MAVAWLAWDIETIPNEDALAESLGETAAVEERLARPEPLTKEEAAALIAPLDGFSLGNCTKDDALRARLATQLADSMRTASKACSLDPLRCRVASSAFATRAPGEEIEGIVNALPDFGGDEAELMRWTWSLIAGAVNSGGGVVGFNSVGFDAHVLAVRSAIHGIDPPVRIDTPRYRYAPNCDLMQWLAGWESSRRRSLDAVCRYSGIGAPKSGIDGSQVAALVDQGRWPEVKQYNLDDVMARTWPLYERFAIMIPGHEGFARALRAGR
jgi:hypothetical protein